MVTWKARLEFEVLGLLQVPVQNQVGGESQPLVCGPLPFLSYITIHLMHSLQAPQLSCPSSVHILHKELPFDPPPLAHISSIGGSKEGACASSKS